MGIIALALAAMVAAGGAAEPLQPSTGWAVDYADNACTLSRSFGTGADAVSLGVMPQTGGARVRVMLVAKNRDLFPEQGRVTIEMGESDGPAIMRYRSVVDPKQGRAALMRMDRTVIAPLDTVKTVTFDLGGTKVSLAVTQMGAAMKALAACEDDLAKSWGFDLSRIAAPPVPTGFPQRWLTNADYPAAALSQAIWGETMVRVSVDVTGKPVACAVTDGSGSLLLDRTSCALIMQRGKFKPATGKDGQPIAGLWATSFRWELPGRSRF